MRNKFFDHLLLLANISFIFGIVLSAILFSRFSDIMFLKWGIYLIPFAVFLVIAMCFATGFAIYRKNYFILISLHISQKCIRYFKWSIFLLFFNIFIAILMVFIGTPLLAANQNTLNFLGKGYFFVIIGIEMLLTLIDITIDAISKIKIKYDIAVKRGVAEFLDEEKDNSKIKNNESTNK